jgi:proline dehydrogenase
MKTAMQELRDDLSQIFHENQIPLKIDISKYLEKEKEQITRAARVCNFEGMRQGAKTSEEFIKYGEQYYNQTYNKNNNNERNNTNTDRVY